MTADEFRAVRISILGMTQVELAAALDVSPSTISNYEGGRSPLLEVPLAIELALEALIARRRE